MSKKFTEEQYQKIVDVADEYIKKSGWGLIGTNLEEPIGSIFEETDLMHQVEFEYVNQEIMAIANPLTREWAHDKFVKKEKRYYWTIKVRNKKIRLYKGTLDETIKTYVIGQETARGTDEQLTESEVKACGYRIDLFDKEEV